MKISELIHIMANPVSEVMKKYGKGNISVDFPSRCIAYAIYKYNKKITIDQDITDRNNPFGIIDPSTNQFIEFNSLQEAIISFKEAPIENEEFEEKYKGIAKANNLYRFDKEILESEPGNIIDTPDTEPSVDQYTVTDKTGKEVTKTSSIEEAKAMAKLSAGTKIFNSRGIAIDAKQKSPDSKNIVPIDLKAGSKIVCNGVNLYYKINDRTPGRSITGDYYLYDGKKVKDRYAVCTKVGGEQGFFLIGFVNAKDIKV